jgi:hypothetical protein
MSKQKREPTPKEKLKATIAAQVGWTAEQIAWDPIEPKLIDVSGTMPDGWIVSYLANETPTICILNPQMSRTYTIKEYQECQTPG